MIGPFHSVILRRLLPVVVTAIQLFAVYVLLHGHYSPGGGFQAGVLLGVSLILPLLVEEETPRLLRISERGAAVMAAIGIFIFAGFGFVPMLLGSQMLDYSTLPLPMDTADRRSLGILGIEVGVTLGVAGAVVSIFYSLYAEPKEKIP